MADAGGLFYLSRPTIMRPTLLKKNYKTTASLSSSSLSFLSFFNPLVQQIAIEATHRDFGFSIVSSIQLWEKVPGRLFALFFRGESPKTTAETRRHRSTAAHVHLFAFRFSCNSSNAFASAPPVRPGLGLAVRKSVPSTHSVPDAVASASFLAGLEAPHGRRYESAVSGLESLGRCNGVVVLVWRRFWWLVGRGSYILGWKTLWMRVRHLFVEIDSYAIALLCSLVGQAWLLDGAYSWCEGVHQ
ncbi:hypothetical protein F4680DRAFT_206653 [Xylaria scruposa]|nr:hypothetical protein F4680DRAFT_206653 [Xylaria scruposa]